MGSNKNIFYASNPSYLLDAMWLVITDNNPQLCVDYSDMVIFLPSRRAVRSAEKMFVQKIGDAVLLPKLIALGEGALDDEYDDDESLVTLDVITNHERIIILAKLLTGDPNIRTISNALPIAIDLVRCQDYLENEGVDTRDIDWSAMVDDKYATHFQKKADLLNLITTILPTMQSGKITETKYRNDAIRAWAQHLSNASKVIVCGSTASVPATADLMEYIANLSNGYIILPGLISGRDQDFVLDTNPYNSEFKFLTRIGVSADEINLIDVGSSEINFFNSAFSNIGGKSDFHASAKLIECDRESVEANAVAKIAARGISENKTVLVITPDAAGNQRIAQALDRHGLCADFSGGMSGIMTRPGRAILNMLDNLIDTRNKMFDEVNASLKNNLFETLLNIFDMHGDLFVPKFDINSDDTIAVWDAIKKISDILFNNGIILTISDARSIVSYALSGVSIRPPMVDDAKIAVLGTIESRMQTADIVILTGLNDGMFPSRGYKNAWLPSPAALKIGLPSPDRKVSLQALDFINLSCGKEVYWLRSRSAGASQTMISRFLSRVLVARGGMHPDTDESILSALRADDNVAYNPLGYLPPRPKSDRTDVYVTELELLIHNPYAFYVRHILRLYPRDDYWISAGPREFGNLVHSVIEEMPSASIDQLVFEMDRRARLILPVGSVLFHFWCKRFAEIAPVAVQMLQATPDAKTEIRGSVNIAGRVVRARADRIWDGFVMDIKTGAAPSKRQLLDGMMPQLPIECYMLANNGFAITSSVKSQTPVLQFLQLQNNNVRLIEYDADTTKKMMDASVQKISELFGRYSRDFEPYEYYETSDQKYKIYDDLARVND